MQLISKKVANVLERKRPLKYLIMRALKATHLCLLFHIDRNSYRLRFYPSVLSGDLWYEPDLRTEDEFFFKRYLRPGDCLIDIGANIGQLALLASCAVGQSGHVIAFEAHPRIFKYLQGNVRLNRARNVLLYNCAVGNDDGTVGFSDRNLDDVNAVVSSGDCIHIGVCRLDSLPIDRPLIELLKVDVEGFEKFVFEGAERILQKTKCIYFESWEGNFQHYGYCCHDLFALLRGSGFEIFRLRAPDTVALISSDSHSTVCENLVAVRDRNDFIARTGFTLKD